MHHYICMQWSSVNTEYRIHPEWHPLHTAFTSTLAVFSWFSLLWVDSEIHLQHSVFLFTNWPPPPPPVSSPWGIARKINLLQSHSRKFANRGMESHHPLSLWINILQIDHLHVLIQSHSSMASKYISTLAHTRPCSAFLYILNLGLKVHLQTQSITAFECITKFTASWDPSVYLKSHVLGLLMHLQSHSITASKWISEFTWSQALSASSNSLWLHPPSATLCSPYPYL